MGFICNFIFISEDFGFLENYERVEAIWWRFVIVWKKVKLMMVKSHHKPVITFRNYIGLVYGSTSKNFQELDYHLNGPLSLPRCFPYILTKKVMSIKMKCFLKHLLFHYIPSSVTYIPIPLPENQSIGYRYTTHKLIIQLLAFPQRYTQTEFCFCS